MIQIQNHEELRLFSSFGVYSTTNVPRRLISITHELSNPHVSQCECVQILTKWNEPGIILN